MDPSQPPHNGQSLSGGGGGGGNSSTGIPTKLSADEMRQRRLAALGSTSTSTADSIPIATASATATDTAVRPPSSSISSTNTSTSPAKKSAARVVGFAPQSVVISSSNSNATRGWPDPPDAELRAALALSMESSTTTATTDNNNNNNNVAVDEPPPIVDYTQHLAVWYQSAAPFDVLAFHQVMWDTSLTTDSDKLRWVGQAINVRVDDDADRTTTPATTTSTSTDVIMAMSSEPHHAATSHGNNMLEAVAESHLPWGLLQQHGGPCGVMAAVQAEMLRLLVFGPRRCAPEHVLDYPVVPLVVVTMENTASSITAHDTIRQALGKSIALVLARAALTPPVTGDADGSERRAVVRLVLPTKQHENSAVLSFQDLEAGTAALSWQDLEPWSTAAAAAATSSSTASAALTVYTVGLPEAAPATAGPKRQKTNESQEALHARILRLARAVSAFLLQPSPVSSSSNDGSSTTAATPLDSFRRPGGVLLLVMSLVASRGKQVIEREFDDPTGTKLTSQFGHCAQELMNLLLTGQAVSNVFDNTLTPAGTVCRGIQSQPMIGYLTQLESMRYCEVGSYYKSPRFPIWVVGSASHFTVLFGEAAALTESKSDMLLDQCRRAFKGVEGGEENGFISTVQLGAVLKSLDLNVGGDHAVQTLAASLEVSGAGIILWDEFWKVTSRLMTGATLETVLQDDDDELPPLLLGESLLGDSGETASGDRKPAPVAAAAPSAATSSSNSMLESDEEMARRLAAEWGSEEVQVVGGTGINALYEAARAASPMEVEPSVGLSDEELARRLQAEWDAEIPGASSSVGAVNGSPLALGSDAGDGGAPFPATPPRGRYDEDSKPQAKASSADALHALDFEKYGDSFQLFHYNGLRGGVLTPFRVTRLSAEEAVGASIALNRGNHSSLHGSGGSDGDLEDVVRTKFPSCMVNWLGKSPPYID